MIDISVIICTYNRCGYLPKLLKSLTRQRLPQEHFEVIVVDNNSTDATRSTTERTQGIENLRYVFEQRRGLSSARNRGLQEARSSIVAYTDDDAYVESGWLEAILDAFSLDQSVACVGGPVKLDWEGTRPEWVPVQFESLYTCVDHGSERRFLLLREYLVGANIAFRCEWLKAVGGFSTDLGRKGRSLLSGEEAQVYQLIFASGRKALYEPAAKVDHRVTRERKTRQWFFRRLFWDGATQPILDTGAGQPRTAYMIAAYYDARRWLRFAAELAFAMCRHDRDGSRAGQARLIQRSGRLWMHLRLAGGKSP